MAASPHLPFRLIKRIPKPVRRHVPAPSCRYRKNKRNNSGFTVLTVHTEAIWPFKMRNRPFNWYRNNKRLMPDRLTPLSQFYSKRFTDKYWFEQRDESPQTKPVEIRSKRKIVGEFFSPVVVDVGRNLTWRVFLTQSILLTHTHVQTRNVSRHVKNVTVGTSARQQHLFIYLNWWLKHVLIHFYPFGHHLLLQLNVGLIVNPRGLAVGLEGWFYAVWARTQHKDTSYLILDKLRYNRLKYFICSPYFDSVFIYGSIHFLEPDALAAYCYFHHDVHITII